MTLRLLLPLLAALVAMGEPARATDPVPDAPAAEELRAVIVEEATTVEVWVALPPTVDPGSVEVQFAGLVVVVRARDDAGRTLRSAPLRLRESVIEDGAEARYEGSWLAVTLRRELPSPEL